MSERYTTERHDCSNTMPLRLHRPTTNVIATFSTLAIFVSMYAFVFWAALYQAHQLEKRYRVGPWEIGQITKVWISGSPGRTQHGVYYYRAMVDFPNLFDGKPRTCSGIANLGTNGSMRPGDKLRIAPLQGTCGDIATAFD